MAALALAVQACSAAAPGGAADRRLLGPPPVSPADRIVGPVRDTIIGAFVGRGLGNQLTGDDVARAEAVQPQVYTAPVGQPVTWTNPADRHSGTVTILRDGRDASGDACREYAATIRVDGQTQQAYGMACRRAGGRWTVIPN